MRRLDSPSLQFALGDRDQVRRQLELAFRQPVSGALLEDAIRAFTLQARNDGQPVERVIVALKEMTIMASAVAPGPDQHTTVNDAVIRWCLDAYYGPGSV